MSSNCEVPESLLPMKDEIPEQDQAGKHGADRSALSNVVRQRRHGCDVIMLKDPKKRLWPVIYHDSPLFMGFIEGWKHLVAANDLLAAHLREEKRTDEARAALNFVTTHPNRVHRLTIVWPLNKLADVPSPKVV
jgi:soluble cytochrome b562